MNMKLLFPAFIGALLFLQGNIAFAEDVDTETSDPKFEDHDLLVDTLTADDAQEVEDAQANLDGLNDDLTAAQEELQEAKDSGTATDEEIQALEENIASLEEEIEQAVNDLADTQQSADDDAAAIADQIDLLSGEQVIALNQKLNNAVSSGLLVDIDAEDLQAVIDGDYNFLQISAFTKAYEEEAKFANLADKFATKADEKGNDKFLDKSDSMLEKGETRKERFLAMIDKFEGKDEVDASNADLDNDGDGLSNLSEFIFGTDPNDANSPVVDSSVVLVSSVLPSSRSVTVGNTATAFATIINGGSSDALGCRIAPITSVAADFFFQTTDPATNTLTGIRDAFFDISPGTAQTFMFGFTPTAAFDATDVQLQFYCTNANAAGVIIGLNSLLLSASDTPIPDIVALGATTTNDGIVHIPGTTGTGFFAVASVNVGSSDNLIVSVDTGDATLPVVLSLCQTDPATGACINPTTPTTGDVTLTINTNGTPTLAVFVQGTEDIALDAAFNRIFLRFKDASGVTRGSTSIAVQTD